MTDDPAARAPISRIDGLARPGPAPRSRLVDRPQGVGKRRLHRPLAAGDGPASDRAQSSIQRQGDADTIWRFNAICDGQRWVAGLALEHLVALGRRPCGSARSLRRSTRSKESLCARAGQRAATRQARSGGRAFMAGQRDAVMSAFMPRAMPDDLALLRVLEATIETLKTENEILKRRLAAAETWAAQAVITKRLDTLAAERARPWWRRLVG